MAKENAIIFIPTGPSINLNSSGGAMGPSSLRMELTDVPSSDGVVRIAFVSGNGYFKFGDSEVEASNVDGILVPNYLYVAYLPIPSGVTHLACYDCYVNITVGYL